MRQRLVPQVQLDQLPADQQMAAHQLDVAVEADARVLGAAVGQIRFAAFGWVCGRRRPSGAGGCGPPSCLVRSVLRRTCRVTAAPAMVAAPMPTQSLRVSLAIDAPPGWTDPCVSQCSGCCVTKYTSTGQRIGSDPCDRLHMILAHRRRPLCGRCRRGSRRACQAPFVDGKDDGRLVGETGEVQPAGGPGPKSSGCALWSTARLLEHPVFALATRPKTIIGPLFSRYQPGHAYGAHVDDALIGGVRGPTSRSRCSWRTRASYDGGELIIDTASGEEAFKLAAGSLVTYPATTLHRVAPVTRGERMAAAGWVRSYRARRRRSASCCSTWRPPAAACSTAKARRRRAICWPSAPPISCACGAIES